MALNAVAQTTPAQITVEQCDTMEFRVQDLPGLPSDRYTWDIYSNYTFNFAHDKGDLDPGLYFVDGMYEGSSVEVIGVAPGQYFLRIMVWDEVSCTNNLELYKFDIIENKPYAEIFGDTACYGEPTKIRIVLTGKGPWDLVYTYGDGTVNVNLNGIVESETTVSIPPLPVGDTQYWILQVTDQCTVNDEIVDKAVVRISPRPSTSRIYVSDMIGP